MLIALKKYIAGMSAKAQKGQIIVFTAVLLPLLIAATGFTVDFGNMYIHKSRLQNAADAAVIAGAWEYVRNNETIGQGNHNLADETAHDYVHRNMNGINDSAIECNAGLNNQGATLYRVRITEDVPVYFLRLFAVGDTTQVSAEAIAQVITQNSQGGNVVRKSIFDNLFSFGENGLHLPWANEQNGLYTSSTFDGNIVSTGNVGSYTGCYDLITAATKEKYNVHKTSQDWNDVQKANDLYKNDPQNYDSVYNTPFTDSDMDLTSELENMREIGNKGAKWDDQNISLKDFINRNDGPVLHYTGKYVDNSNVQIDSFAYASSEKEAKENPIYIVIDTAGGTHNLTLGVSSNMSAEDRDKFMKFARPVIYVYTGTSTLNLHFNSSIFKGIIYAPNGGIFTNETGLDFSGSIVAKDISMQGRNAVYNHVSIIGGGSNSDGSSGNIGSEAPSVDVGLTTNIGTVNWD